MRLGLMLAAGEATRMPNKPFLPIDADGTTAIGTGIAFLGRWCEHTCVVTRANSLVKPVLGMLGYEAIYVEQIYPGVTGAIASAVAVGDWNEVLVAFCDNVYSPKEQIARDRNSWPTVSVRERASAQLDGWDGSQWVSRNVITRRKIAGWLLLDIEDIMTARSHNSLVKFLNAINAKPHECSLPWHDIGTEESYLDYIAVQGQPTP